MWNYEIYNNSCLSFYKLKHVYLLTERVLYTSPEIMGCRVFGIMWERLLLFSHQVLGHSCVPTDCSPSGSSVHGISQARILEQVAISFSMISSQPRDWTFISCTASGFFATKPPGKPHEKGGACTKARVHGPIEQPSLVASTFLLTFPVVLKWCKTTSSPCKQWGPPGLTHLFWTSLCYDQVWRWKMLGPKVKTTQKEQHFQGRGSVLHRGNGWFERGGKIHA